MNLTLIFPRGHIASLLDRRGSGDREQDGVRIDLQTAIVSICKLLIHCNARILTGQTQIAQCTPTLKIKIPNCSMQAV